MTDQFFQIMGYKLYTHELRSGYAARIDNFRSYDTVSKDVIQRWTYPMVPDVISNRDCSESRLHRQGIYKASGIWCLIFYNRFISRCFIYRLQFLCSCFLKSKISKKP